MYEDRDTIKEKGYILRGRTSDNKSKNTTEIKSPNLGEGGRQHVLFTEPLHNTHCPPKREWNQPDPQQRDGAGVLASDLLLSPGLDGASSAFSGIGQRGQVQLGPEGFSQLRGQQLVQGHAVVGVHPVPPRPVVALGAAAG